MSGTLDYSSGLTGSGGPSIGEVDDTGNLLVGTINGRIKVFVDPYSANVADKHYYVVGYKGSSPYDAGLFYCPYVPLQMVRSIGPDPICTSTNGQINRSRHLPAQNWI